MGDLQRKLSNQTSNHENFHFIKKCCILFGFDVVQELRILLSLAGVLDSLTWRVQSLRHADNQVELQSTVVVSPLFCNPTTETFPTLFLTKCLYSHYFNRQENFNPVVALLLYTLLARGTAVKLNLIPKLLQTFFHIEHNWICLRIYIYLKCTTQSRMESFHFLCCCVFCRRKLSNKLRDLDIANR